MVLGLPLTNPKLADVVTALGVVDTELKALSSRIAELERWRAEHEASKVIRQQQVDEALRQLRRMRPASPS